MKHTFYIPIDAQSDQDLKCLEYVEEQLQRRSSYAQSMDEFYHHRCVVRRVGGGHEDILVIAIISDDNSEWAQQWEDLDDIRIALEFLLGATIKYNRILLL